MNIFMILINSKLLSNYLLTEMLQNQASSKNKHCIYVKNEDKINARVLITIFNVQLVSLGNLANYTNVMTQNKSPASNQGST